MFGPRYNGASVLLAEEPTSGGAGSEEVTGARVPEGGGQRATREGLGLAGSAPPDALGVDDPRVCGAQQRGGEAVDPGQAVGCRGAGRWQGGAGRRTEIIGPGAH